MFFFLKEVFIEIVPLKGGVAGGWFASSGFPFVLEML